MDAQHLTRIDTLLSAGRELLPEGGSEFSGYNAKKQGKYLLWRKNCLDALNAMGKQGAKFSARAAKDENGLYFYHSSVEHILTVMEEARAVAQEAEDRAKAEAAAREEALLRKARAEAEAQERARREEEARKEAEDKARREEEEARKEAEENARKEAEERARREEEARKEAEEKARREAEERARQAEKERKEAEERARREEEVRKAAEERARREEAERKAAEEKVQREEAERKAAEEHERLKREADARKEAEEQVEALKTVRTQETAANAREEAEIAIARAGSESSPAVTAPPAAVPPKILIYSLANHVMLKQVRRFFEELSLPADVITHADGIWSSLDLPDAGTPYYAIFLLSDRYHGQELMALGYLAGRFPSIRLCAVHAQTLMLGALLPGVSKQTFTVSFDEVKPRLVAELKAAGCPIA